MHALDLWVTDFPKSFISIACQRNIDNETNTGRKKQLSLKLILRVKREENK